MEFDEGIKFRAKQHLMLARIRSVIFFCVVGIITPLFSLVSIPGYIIPGSIGRRWVRSAGRIWARWFLCWLRLCCGVRYQFNDPHGVLSAIDKPVIFASRHESAWETIAFTALLPDTAIILKRVLLWIPIYGWYAWRAGMIAINRSGGSKTMRQMISQAKLRQSQGYHLLIFPEGTRARPGEVLPIQPGVAALAKQLDCPVVPIALQSGHCWPKKRLVLQPGVVRVKVQLPLQTGDRQELLRQLKAAIAPNI